MSKERLSKTINLLTLVLIFTIILVGCGNFIEDNDNGHTDNSNDFVNNDNTSNNDDLDNDNNSEKEDISEDNWLESQYKDRCEEKIKATLTFACKNNFSLRDINKINVLACFDNGEIYIEVISIDENNLLIYDTVKVILNGSLGEIKSYKSLFKEWDKLSDKMKIDVYSNVNNDITYASYVDLTKAIIDRTHRPNAIILSVKKFWYQEGQSKYLSEVIMYDSGSVYICEITIDDSVVDSDDYLESCALAFGQNQSGTLIYTINQIPATPFSINGSEINLNWRIE